MPEISENGHFRDLGPSWGLDGGPDSQNYQNDLPNDPWDTQIQQKHTNKQTNYKKNGGRSALYFLLLGDLSAGRVLLDPTLDLILDPT